MKFINCLYIYILPWFDLIVNCNLIKFVIETNLLFLCILPDSKEEFLLIHLTFLEKCVII